MKKGNKNLRAMLASFATLGALLTAGCATHDTYYVQQADGSFKQVEKQRHVVDIVLDPVDYVVDGGLKVVDKGIRSVKRTLNTTVGALNDRRMVGYEAPTVTYMINKPGVAKLGGSVVVKESDVHELKQVIRADKRDIWTLEEVKKGNVHIIRTPRSQCYDTIIVNDLKTNKR